MAGPFARLMVPVTFAPRKPGAVLPGLTPRLPVISVVTPVLVVVEEATMPNPDAVPIAGAAAWAPDPSDEGAPGMLGRETVLGEVERSGDFEPQPALMNASVVASNGRERRRNVFIRKIQSRAEWSPAGRLKNRPTAT